ncbi:hypothetical protein EIN_223520 [Entamoeba invadens IP1]|uniref:CCHC-type domain-containing protein n=1 Tax=Entamoeba invadens IP1 TaxID=370355 RepID=A0A0A1U295_ENTIV|nr:hypothetical protein EIN_223520 [Entamoeba invadens IP1]ELP88149.1 hypothetical protein EIN_223520 [Entamoeba invadens IP1]|eukprot:XP_004254920.1 hypothetical protein EIN_223520 [Entamoeba invadens IP1]
MVYKILNKLNIDNKKTNFNKIRTMERRRCKNCGSNDHWTYQCKEPVSLPSRPSAMDRLRGEVPVKYTPTVLSDKDLYPHLWEEARRQAEAEVSTIVALQKKKQEELENERQAEILKNKWLEGERKLQEEVEKEKSEQRRLSSSRKGLSEDSEHSERDDKVEKVEKCMNEKSRSRSKSRKSIRQKKEYSRSSSYSERSGHASRSRSRSQSRERRRRKYSCSSSEYSSTSPSPSRRSSQHHYHDNS